jgi:enterochelin esterase-like enzyme
MSETAYSAEPAANEHGPDSEPSDVTPKGKVTQHVWLDSQVFPGTKRRYSVYVPAQYDGKTPAALMVFQDGENDLDNVHGNWPLANQQMAKALAFAGYDYKFVFGTGAHIGNHGGAIFPDSLRWLWRGWKEQTP